MRVKKTVERFEDLPDTARISAATVASLMDVHLNTVWRRARMDPTFPKPIKLGNRCTRFLVGDIRTFMKGVPARPSAAPTTINGSEQPEDMAEIRETSRDTAEWALLLAKDYFDGVSGVTAENALAAINEYLGVDMEKKVGVNEKGYRVGQWNQGSKFSDRVVEQVRYLRDQGLLYREIAEKMEMSYHTVLRICRHERRAEQPTRFKRVEA